MPKSSSLKKMSSIKGFAAAMFISFAAASANAQEAHWQSRVFLSAEPAEPIHGEPRFPSNATIDKARESFARRQSFYSKEDMAAKAVANRASDEAVKFSRAFKYDNTVNDFRISASPAIVGSFNKPGLSADVACMPWWWPRPHASGAIGAWSYIQLTGCHATILDRTTGVPLATGQLSQLAGNFSHVSIFDPQIIWDPTTARYYYTLILEVENENQLTCFDECYYNSLVFGFSKTPEPRNFSTDWCRYAITLYKENLLYPRLGDDRDFAIITVGSYHSSGGFFGPKIFAISKPGAATSCPAQDEFRYALSAPLKDSTGALVVAPAPANQIDNYATGYVVARNKTMPSDKLWFFTVRKDSATNYPVFGPARGVTVPTYDIPPDATQPQFTQKLDTGDARLTQAMQGVDTRLRKHAFWTQHTIANGAYSTVRWYEFDILPATPVILRWGNSSAPTSNAFHYNAAISSDRVKQGVFQAFGNSFVIEFNQSSSVLGMSPRIVAASSVDGQALAYRAIRNAVGPYRDQTCAAEGSTCYWGLTSSASPDPRPNVSGSGVVWGMSAYSGMASPPTTGVNWLTQIFALKP